MGADRRVAAVTQLGAVQILAYVRRHTSDPNKQAVAVATALAESGGRTDARNVNRDSSTDRGLWQINSRWHPSVTASMADDPAAATAYAARISRNFSDMGAWYGYTNGGYKQHMPAATAAVGQTSKDPGGSLGSAIVGGAVLGVPGAVIGATSSAPIVVGGAVVDGAKGAAHAALSTGEFLAKLADRSTWVRVLYVVGGLGAVVAGGLMLNSDVIKGAAGAAADFVPAGRVVKAAGAVATKATS